MQSNARTFHRIPGSCALMSVVQGKCGVPWSSMRRPATGGSYPAVHDCVLRLRRRAAGCWPGGAAGTMARVTGQFPLPDVPPGLSVLEAALERITYANEDTGDTIARVATERTGPDLLTVVGALLGAQGGESPRLARRGGPGGGERAADGAVEQPPPLRAAVPSVFLCHRAAGDDPGHPPLPGVGVDQRDRPGDGRADGGPFRHRHPGRHRAPAGPADRG